LIRFAAAMEMGNEVKFKDENWKPKVLVTHTELPKEGLRYLTDKCDVSYAKSKERGDILKKVKGVDGLLWASLEPLDAEVLDAAGPQLKAISTKSAGVNHIDVDEIKKRKIPLGHTPVLPSEPTGEIAIGLALAAARRFHEGRLQMNKDQWEDQPQTFLGVEIRDSVIGIVGFGGIGQAIAKDIRGFAPQEIIYSGHSEKPEAEKLDAKFVSFDELIERSDFVFIACPLNSKTHKMFNAEVFNKMKPTSVLVNVARGNVVDQEALYDALKNNKIFAAGLDVMTPEPLPSNHPLMSLPNCGKNS
jgi:glyoxylate/hydroxypyruvate reductase